MTAIETRIITCDQCAHEQKPETIATETMYVRFQSDLWRAVDLCAKHADAWRVLKTIAKTRGELSGSGIKHVTDKGRK